MKSSADQKARIEKKGEQKRAEKKAAEKKAAKKEKVNGYGYASTMCIGNLRSGTESLSIYLRDRNIGALKKTAHYYGIILIFAIGAGIGGVCSLHIGIRAIWASSVLLAIVCTMMVREHR